jgi:hypothetical protein
MHPQFHQTTLIPKALKIGRPSKRSNDLTAFIEARTLQDLSLSGPNLANESATEFGVNVSRTTINLIRKGLRFRYHSAWHNQAGIEMHEAVRVALCRKTLSMARFLPKIPFSHELRIVLGGDKRWIWYCEGEDNPAALKLSIKFPPSVMVFAVIGIDFKSDLLFVEGSIDLEGSLCLTHAQL